MKAIYNYKNEYHEFLDEIADHLTFKPEYGDKMVINVKNVRLNGVKIPNANCIQLAGNVIQVGVLETRPVTSGETGESLGKSYYITPIVELWETTDGMRLHDLRFERQVGTTDKYRTYHYILE